MRQYLGVLLTTITVLLLFVSHELIISVIALIIYIVGISLIIIPQKTKVEQTEAPRAQPRAPPAVATPEELKKRPVRPPEVE
ncbi:MAG: hypothetical protein QXP98_06460 [Thermoproteus sp.]